MFTESPRGASDEVRKCGEDNSLSAKEHRTILISYHQSYNKKIIVLRLFNDFGFGFRKGPKPTAVSVFVGSFYIPTKFSSIFSSKIVGSAGKVIRADDCFNV